MEDIWINKYVLAVIFANAFEITKFTKLHFCFTVLVKRMGLNCIKHCC